MSEEENSTSQRRGIISKDDDIILDVCTAENCCNGKMHCPFCDIHHFKPTKPHRVRDHLEVLHLSYAVQAEDVTIVKCFWSCGQVAGHYHCPYCPSKLLKRHAFTFHLHSHMKKMGKDKSCISVPDPKYPNTIKGYGKEIHLCKDESCYKAANVKSTSDTVTPNTKVKGSEPSADPSIVDVQGSGPHYHCPVCNVLRNRRSPLINHLWRCMEQPHNSRALSDNWKKATSLLSKELENVPHPRDVKGLKYHQSIVRTLNDLPMEKCYAADCNCGHKYHCTLCTKEKFKPNFQQHLQYHYYAHWKRRIQYKEYSILLCNGNCEFEKGCHKIRYHFHCPICGSTRRRRKSFARHLKICPGFVSSKVSKRSVSTIQEESIVENSESKYQPDETETNGDLSSTFLMAEQDEDIGGNENPERDCDGGSEVTPVEREETSQTQSLKDLEIYEYVIAKLSEKCVGALRNIEISDIALRSGAEVVWSTEEVGNLHVHELVGNLKVLQMTKELLLKAITGDVNTEQIRHTKQYEEKTTQTDGDMYPKNCVDAGIQVEVDSLSEEKSLPICETSSHILSKSDKVSKNTSSSQSPSQRNKRPLNNSDKDMNVTLKEPSLKRAKVSSEKVPESPGDSLVVPVPSPKKRGRPRKLNSCLKQSNVKVQKVVTPRPDVQSPVVTPRPDVQSPVVTPRPDEQSPVLTPRPDVQSPDVTPRPDEQSPVVTPRPDVQSPVVTPRPDVQSPVVTPRPDVQSPVVTPRPDVQSPGANIVKRKRGRPRKDGSNNVSVTEESFCEKDPDDVCDITPETNVFLSNSKRYSTRGKKIDYSHLVGKPKKNEIFKMNAENDLNDLSCNEDSPSSETVGNSCSNSGKTGDALLINSSSETNEVTNDGDDDSNVNNNVNNNNNNSSKVILESDTNDNKRDSKTALITNPSKSKDSSKKPKSRAFRPLVMSDVAVLPAIRDLFTTKRRQRQKNNVKNGTDSKSKSTAGDCGSGPLPSSSSSTSEVDAKQVGSNVNQTSKTSESKPLSLSHTYDLLCHLCGLQVTEFDKMTEHLTKVHNIESPLRCDVCERTFDRLFDLRSHLSRKHGPFPQLAIVYCSICGKNFQGTAKLNWHMSFIHKITKEPDPKKASMKCNQCSFVASNYSALVNHKEIHVDDSKLCNLCGKLFSKGNHLITHIQAVHTKEKAAECKQCGKQFNHIRYLRSHMKRHEGIKKHQCNLCGWRFFESNTLKDHLETHKDVSKRKYRFTCEYCGQKHISKANFNDHVNKHTGNKPHKCQQCGKGFAFRTMLMKHQIHIHTTEKPFKCTCCDRAFKFKSKLLQHMVIHTGISKYVCQNCNKPFSCAATLKHHQPRCKGDTSWQQNKTVISEGMTLMVDGLRLEQQQLESGEDIAIPVGNQNDIVIDMSNLSGIPEGNILQAAAQAAQLMEMPEVFMCSECNTVFSSLTHAENHVTTCRIDVATIDTPNIEIKALED